MTAKLETMGAFGRDAAGRRTNRLIGDKHQPEGNQSGPAGDRVFFSTRRFHGQHEPPVAPVRSGAVGAFPPGQVGPPEP